MLKIQLSEPPCKLRHRINLSKESCLHISEVSAVMVGSCLAGVGLIHVAVVIQKLDTYVDDLLALDSLIFLMACLTAYCSFRSFSTRRTLQLEMTADICFVTGMVMMVVICLLTAYSSFATT